MAYEHLKDSALPRALSDVVGDLADLFQKEMRLARAELSSKLSLKIRGGIWMACAGALAVIAALLVIEAIVFAIASFGIAMHWSCLIVAAALALAGGLAYAAGRGALAAELTPSRTINQIKQDVNTAREQIR
jgi:putative superfamily III holin-X